MGITPVKIQYNANDLMKLFPPTFYLCKEQNNLAHSRQLYIGEHRGKSVTKYREALRC